MLSLLPMGGLTCSKDAEHHHRVPDRVLREERNSLALLQPILLDQCGTDIRAVLCDLPPVDSLFRNGIGVAAELVVREPLQGGEIGIEEPVPVCEVGWHYRDGQSSILPFDHI